MEWIKVEDKKPQVGQLVVAWLIDIDEPTCCKIEEDKNGIIFMELVDIDIWDDSRESKVSHWMPLPEPPED